MMHQLRNLIIDGRVQKVKYLIDNQKLSAHQLTQKDPENNTPLHWAVKFKYTELIENLLNTAAKQCKSIRNQHGLTPYDIAKKSALPSQLLLKLRSKEIMAANSPQEYIALPF